MKEIIMPIQPIKDGRFIKNRIVDKLLDTSTLDMNDIAVMDFTQQERIQFAQLIGYSIGGFGDLSYVDDETYYSAEDMEVGITELEARNKYLRNVIKSAKEGVKVAAGALFSINEDDLAD